MLNLKYIGEPNNYAVAFKKINDNVVEIKGDIPTKETGFILTRIGDPFAFKGDYSAFKTLYREVEGGLQYSNNGSIYIEPLPKVKFSTNGGGFLNGETLQEAERFENLTIPTPTAYENYEFAQWIPEIPESGDIDGNKMFIAAFTSTLPEPEPEPSIDERVTALEDDVKAINEALGG